MTILAGLIGPTVFLRPLISLMFNRAATDVPKKPSNPSLCPCSALPVNRPRKVNLQSIVLCPGQFHEIGGK